MGSDVKKFINPSRQNISRIALGGPSLEESKIATKKAETPLRSGKSRKARKESRKIEKQSLLQQQRESIRLAEAEDEVAQRRGLASSKKAGRQSLIRSSGGGIVKTLGGT